jgi:hypothetical protein
VTAPAPAAGRRWALHHSGVWRPPPGQVRQLWRRWRGLVSIALTVALAGVAIGLLQHAPANSYLSPGSTSASGTRALADVLTGLGRQLREVTTVSSAIAGARPGSTLVITSPGYLSGQQLTSLAATRARILLVEPDAPSLAAIAPGIGVSVAGQPVRVTPPGCTLAAAVLAGPADMGGTALDGSALDGSALAAGPAGPGVRQCYRAAGGPTLVVLDTRGRQVTILGTASPLTNAGLGSQGNAALAVNLLATRQIIWLVPPVAALPVAAGSRKSFISLVPLAAWLVAIQLAVALLLAAAWRARRLGPLVAEPIPVVVRASETTEGHGRLYEARRARATAADGLRSAFLRRIGPAIGLPPRPDRDTVVGALEAHSGQDGPRIGQLLYDAAPGTDRALVELARDLDDLEREAGTS